MCCATWIVRSELLLKDRPGAMRYTNYTDSLKLWRFEPPRTILASFWMVNTSVLGAMVVRSNIPSSESTYLRIRYDGVTKPFLIFRWGAISTNGVNLLQKSVEINRFVTASDAKRSIRAIVRKDDSGGYYIDRITIEHGEENSSTNVRESIHGRMTLKEYNNWLTNAFFKACYMKSSKADKAWALHE